MQIILSCRVEFELVGVWCIYHSISAILLHLYNGTAIYYAYSTIIISYDSKNLRCQDFTN